ncbi:hypothetical protein QQF64_024314 [Cirrhinus molitorella]|uniref:Uncharacterized protein n=1 Tax=Cirrhinus molitorella TaxID=172907 RepID=A0ABR3NLS6_9TELE
MSLYFLRSTVLRRTQCVNNTALSYSRLSVAKKVGRFEISPVVFETVVARRKLNSDQAPSATANTWASCYPTRPPVPMHAALETHSSAPSPHSPALIHPLALTLSPLNAEKHASLPAAVPVPESRSSGSGLQPPATRKMADIPCQWQIRLSLSPSVSLSL